MNIKVDGLIQRFVTLPYFKDTLRILLVLILTVPLLFINIRKDIDWGDDNAHYLLQAKYIAQGVPQTDTQYIYNSNCPVLGPPAYPIGFPLMLSGVYYVKGLNLHAFSLVMTLALISLCLLMVLYYKNTHRFLTSVFLILIVAYNPWTLSFKSEIMSEIPFTVILLATVLLYKKFNHIATFIILGVLCGYLISVRTIGVVLPLAIVAETTKNFLLAFLRKEKNLTKTLRHNLLKLGIIITFCFGIYFLLNTVIFKIKFDASNGYFAIFSFRGLGNIILQNLAYYSDVLEAFFNPKNDKWVFLPLITKSCVFTMIMLGWLKKLVKDVSLTDFLVVFYLLVLLIYPYHQSGFRFLFPLLPFLMSYAAQGLKTIHLGINPKTSVKVVLLGSLVLVQYYYGFNELKKAELIRQEGPCSSDAWEAFDFIKTHTPHDVVIAFTKPRALALFTDRKCIANNISQTEMHPLVQKFDEARVGYYLLYCCKENEDWSCLLDEMVNPPLEKYIATLPNEISLLWSNPRFKLYKRMTLK